MKRISISALILCACFVPAAWGTCPAHTPWAQFHRYNMRRSNPCEKVLTVSNVKEPRLEVELHNRQRSGVLARCGERGGLFRLLRRQSVRAERRHRRPAVELHDRRRAVLARSGEWGGVCWRRGTATFTRWTPVPALSCGATPPAGYVESSPTVTNGVVYVGSWDYNVYALNASTGAMQWNYTTGDGVAYLPAVANGVVYVGSEDSTGYALDASTGALLWQAGGLGGYTSPAVANGMVYFGAYDVLAAFDASTGAQLWTYIVRGYVWSSFATGNGVVYIGSDDHNVYALNAKTGAKLWSYSTGSAVHGSSAAVANGVVYVGSDDGNVYALNAKTGAKLWSHAISSGWSSPAVANGMMYIGGGNNVYAFSGLKVKDGRGSKDGFGSPRLPPDF